MTTRTRFKGRIAAAIAAAAVLPVEAGNLPGPAAERSLRYSLRELEVPSGFVSSRAVGMNAFGGAVGNIEHRDGRSHAAVWTAASATPIDLGAGFGASKAIAINRIGAVVGVADGSPVVWAPEIDGYRATVLWTGPGEARDISKKGVITGSIRDADGHPHAFVIVPEDREGDGTLVWFRDDDPTDGHNDLLCRLDDETGPSAGSNLNDVGWVVGNPHTLIRPKDLDGDGRLDWFRDANGDGRNDLSTPIPGAADINNELQVVAEDLLLQLRVGDDGALSHLATTMPAPEEEEGIILFAEAISDAGVVVGRGTGPAGRSEAFRWEVGTGTIMLEDLVPEMGKFLHLDRARDVNFSGQIVGTGTTTAGRRGFLAAPNQ